MSNVTNTDPVVTESKLTEFYEDIKPFLGCPAYVTQEGDAEYYSTDEKVVGRWTDGKPLYQKVIYFNPQITITANSWQNIKSDETDIEYIADAIILRNDGIFIPQYGSVSPFIGTRGLWVYTTQLQNAIQGIILKYTKTTDSALTTIEVSPTHYSTDEQVVGTWIDGKPLYQKTITGNASFPALTWNTVAFLPENIIILEGTAVWNYNSFNAQIIACDWFYSTSDNSLQIFNTRNNSYVASPSSFTIRYVKPTD